jgi:ketol-acid reductoisomerase
MESNLFDVIDIDLDATTERILAGGRHLFPLLPEALRGITQIGVIGWGPQGRAQAMNLRDSLAGSDIRVAVGLRAGSSSYDGARADGFSEATGTLGDMMDIVRTSDLVILLMADAALVERHAEIFAALKPDAIIGLSHGFLLAHLQSAGGCFPSNHSVIAVCPKGMGKSVRRLYEQGRDVDGAGINCSVAVHADVDGRATDVALAWAIGIGAPFVFETTLESEYLSDIAGERAILLGIPHAIAEAMYRRRIEMGDEPAAAFMHSTETMTGPLARVISHGGVRTVLDEFTGDERATFDHAYCAAYAACAPIVAELYDEVRAGNEVSGVCLAARRGAPMPEIDGNRMWQVGADVRAARDGTDVAIDPTTAGLFCGAMLAQVDVFRAEGHPWSEIANESIIEAVDSLIPFMHARGIAHMVDNCSTTARLGARKWGPRFEAAFNQQVFPRLDGPGARDESLIGALEAHPIHDVLDTIAKFRPAVDIAVE